MEKYESLEILIIEFESDDVIVTSTGTEMPEDPIGGNGDQP